MQKAKIKNCKKLSLRGDLETQTCIGYFRENDTFLVDTSKVWYDYRNIPMYKAKRLGGKEGYVAKEGVDLIAGNNLKREYLKNHKKNASRK